MFPLRVFVLALASLAAVIGLAACGGKDESSSSGGSGAGGGSLTLVAYSTPQEAYQQGLIPGFKKTPDGEGATFKQSYGGSGDQARAVEGGLPTDVVALSLAPDVNKLVDAGLVAKNWHQDKFQGFVTNSVVVFAVRKGNPKNIKTWDDLIKDDTEVIEPNPFTSGGAKWNIMAAVGAQKKQGRSPAQSEQYLKALFDNVEVQDKSARDSLQTFEGGKGDVLIAYENEALGAQKKGQELDYVIPDQTILIQNPIAVTTDARNAETAKAFIDYTRSEEGQKTFADYGYRPVLKSVDDPQKFPDPPGLFDIGYVGGWSDVNDVYFDPEKGVMAGILSKKGFTTEK